MGTRAATEQGQCQDAGTKAPAQATGAKSRLTFKPSQQLVFLYLLYSEDEFYTASQVQRVLNASSGSVSLALKLFVRLCLVEWYLDGRSRRMKKYRIEDKALFYQRGIQYFGTPVHTAIKVPRSMARSEWLKCGLSALAQMSDIPEPQQAEYALSYGQWMKFLADVAGDEGVDEHGVRELTTSARNKLTSKRAMAKIEAVVAESADELCVAKELWYDPSLFASNGRVDPVTMLTTIDKETMTETVEDALTQVYSSYNWYQS